MSKKEAIARLQLREATAVIVLDKLKSLVSKRPKGIGVELTPEQINIVQVLKKGQAYKLQSFHSLEVPEGIYEDGQILDAPAMAELIQTCLAENKITVKNAASAVSGREAVTRLIPVPAELDDNELREMVLNQEAGLYLPFPREEADVDYQKLDLMVDDDGIEKVRVLLVATRKEVTDNYINTFEQAGLRLDVLEIGSFSLIRTIREELRQFALGEAVAIANIEFEGTEIAIVVDGVPQFSRTVPIGTQQIQNALCQAMNLPPSRNPEILQGMTIPLTPVDSVQTGMTGSNPGAAAMVRVLGELADELRRSIDFYVNQGENQEVAQLLLAGSGAGIGQLDEFLTQRLSVPTSQVDPIEALSLEAEMEIPPAQRPGLGIALGLGLRYVM
ncbi:type IV pilus assembly protein PilM [Roseofilum sp. BLCC_M91]|uniref:Type IV pilus assembly protein PilM n=2 Tax=Roseofilum TaxID=1233426 RepID=A0ABT7B385_9CYAN|nr:MULTISPECIES: type IV pilus assembly protein PilM [Roseofilum]MDJ1173639.1 type IV pilus assembly protein PilM [Roseofilum capinflatum BLCC-M114]MDJ1177841.1 type IV pilus assembly protein PilM [Roseofilum halophilum BLCC-M91]